MSAARMITSLIGAFGGGAVGNMLGGRTGGMIGSMAGSMLARKMRSGGGAGGIGDLLGGLTGSDDGQQQAAAAASTIDDGDAMILIRAMCNAAKADGTVDDAEIDAIVSRAGALDAEDEAMLRAELRAPLDIDGFITDVPSGMEADVYAASLLPITIDTPAEVQYLQQLGQGLGLSTEAMNSIHQELGLK